MEAITNSVEPVQLDVEAAEQLAFFINGSASANEDADIALRISVVGGGCAGFQYRLGLDHAKEDDHIFESEGQKVIVDPVSMNFVGGSIITYRNDLDQQGFEVINPHAEAACGCGSSFTVKD